MPMASEHSARQLPPSKCEKFRRDNDKLGSGVSVIWCVNPGKAVEIQSIRFDASKFTVDEAKAWLKKHNFSAANFEPAAPSKAGAGCREVDIKAEGLSPALRITGASESLELQAESVSPAGVKLRAFAMTAYTGAAMKLEKFPLPVVVDLEGMHVPTHRMAILRNHDPERIVGHSDKVEVSVQRLRLSGFISGVGPHAKEVLDLAANDFPWQASMGADVNRLEKVEQGQTVKVNGRNFEGPLYVARKTTLGEVSFVPRGADFNTSAAVAASGNQTTPATVAAT